MNRAQFIAAHPICETLEERGVKVIGQGNQRKARCCFHEDKEPSMSIKVSEGVWNCHAGCGGGSVIDLLAKLAGMNPSDFLKQQGVTNGEHEPKPPNGRRIERIYSYRDAIGREVYQAIRYHPKTFSQRRQENGQWVNSMEGVERVLYNLPEVIASQQVWIVEGEKDADNLTGLGYVATCNVGGAGKWLDGYTESLIGKDVAICGDNDDAGRKHVEKVFDSLAGKVRSARLIKLPVYGDKQDVSDYIATFKTTEEAKAALDLLLQSSTPFIGGIKLPIYTMAEIEPLYKQQVRSQATSVLDLSKWLPSFRGNVRNLVPGELVLIIGDTGTGKTALLQNVAEKANPLPTLMFELELPAELLYERFAAIKMGIPCSDIEKAYREQDDALGSEALDRKFPHLFICSESRLSLDQIETYIVRSELKIGQKPKLVLLDYVQLIDGSGKRYERTSDAAEGLKVMAKSTGTIVVVASQVHRPQDSEVEISLHSAKDSGSLENSAGLVLGAWRDERDKSLLHVKVLKNTKGTGGLEILCNFDGSTMRVTERTPNPLR